jgi:hypothetical protein
VGAVVDVVVSVVALFVIVWVAIFGGLGAVLAWARDGSPGAGLVWGAMLGPIGWAIVLWRTRTSTRPVSAETWTRGTSELDDDWTADLFGPERSSGARGPREARHDF